MQAFGLDRERDQRVRAASKNSLNLRMVVDYLGSHLHLLRKLEPHHGNEQGLMNILVGMIDVVESDALQARARDYEMGRGGRYSSADGDGGGLGVEF